MRCEAHPPGYSPIRFKPIFTDMITAGQYYDLTVARLTENGVYLDDGKEGILLPKRFVPENIRAGDTVRAFIYHDSEGRIIATTQKPHGVVGDIVKLSVTSVTPQGAFMDWGLMKDLFVPQSQQISKMLPKGEYFVKIYVDEQTGRVAATEKVDLFLQNHELTVKENDPVSLLVYRRTDIGYVVIINNLHTGVLHFSDIYRNITAGDRFTGFIKKIRPNKTGDAFLIDVAAGTKGYERTDPESEKILELLRAHDGYLPYYDKSDPEEIYDFFGMSKKTFKMAVGKLYKERKITLEKTGIKLAGEN